MAWYDVGTVSVTNGSTTVTGSGTNFIAGAQVGEAFLAPDDKLYEIASITSATVLVLADNYLGSTQSGQDYKIVPTQSLVADLASDVTDLIADYADVKDKAGAGKFNDGSVTSPAITFEQDQNNGLYRIGSDNYAMSAGGTKQIDISTTDVELNYSGSKKLATTSTGVDVTGTVTADALTVDGTSKMFGSLQVSSDDADFYGVNIGGGEENNAKISIGDWHNSQAYFRWDSSENELYIDSQHSTNPTTINFTGADESKNMMTLHANGNVSFYEDTGTTAKMVWSSSAESLSIGNAAGFGALRVGHVGDKVEALVIGDNTTPANDTGIYLRSDTLGVISVGSSASLSFKTGGGSGTERMRIDSSGNVGIGVASPEAEARLSVAGGRAYFDAPNEYTLRVLKSGVAGAFIGTSAANTLNFYNGTGSERARLDNSGNLLVGQTTPSNITAGMYVRPSSSSGIIADGAGALTLGRLNSDGDIVNFLKDGSPVGSIGTNGGTLYISSPYGSDAGLIIGNGFVAPSTTSGSASNNTIDLGYSGNAFKSLFLSGLINIDNMRIGELYSGNATGFDDSASANTWHKITAVNFNAPTYAARTLAIEIQWSNNNPPFGYTCRATIYATMESSNVSPSYNGPAAIGCSANGTMGTQLPLTVGTHTSATSLVVEAKMEIIDSEKRLFIRTNAAVVSGSTPQMKVRLVG